ncbi:hypothetical protein ACN47E_005903 [Coniothyrium glycines]
MSIIENFRLKHKLGQGGDGTVYAYEHIHTKLLIAAKMPSKYHTGSALCIRDEIANFKKLGNHAHLVQAFECRPGTETIKPSILLEYCELGDLPSYRDRWAVEQYLQGTRNGLPEATIWKLLRDISLGLDFIHNGHAQRYVHGDLKCSNILVTPPAGWIGPALPAEPDFKIADFARLSTYPAQSLRHAQKWTGTPEYAPPQVEQEAQVKPSADMWSLGAIIQVTALGEFPLESKKAYKRRYEQRRQRGETVPAFHGWNHDLTRNDRRTVYRPICETEQILRLWHDFCETGSLAGFQPYSPALESWYSTLWNTQENMRMTSADLVKYAVPLVDRNIAIQDRMRHAYRAFEEAKRFREEQAMCHDYEM